jgi:tripartite-type tricarboxylate transporter receptor subunit TctC
MGLIKHFVAASLLAAAVPVLAQSYPTKPVTLIVPTSIGTGPDLLGRFLGAKMAERWGVAAVVDNRVGAGSIVGSEAAARAPGDGYTLLLAPTSFALQPAVEKVTGYDLFRSFVPIGLIATGGLALVVSESTPATSVGELVALAKKQPGKLNYATPGAGTPQHLAMELLKLDGGFDMVHVPYKDNGSALRELAGGFANAFISPVYTVAPLVKSGKARALANVGSERSPVFPNVPTLKEQGYPNVDVVVWVGLMSPASTPAPIVARLNGDLNAVLALQDVKDFLDKQGFIPAGGRPERLSDLIKSDYARWTKAAAAAKIKVN